MNTRIYQKSFAGGIIAPEMFGRIDDVKYQNGVAELKNFVVRPQGVAIKRPGLEFRASTRRDANDTRTTKSRLLAFSFSLTQSVVLELRGYNGVQSAGTYGTIRIHDDSGLTQHLNATPYIAGITVTFSNEVGSIRVNSVAWTGTPPATPPFFDTQRVTFRNTGGSLPSNLVAGRVYYVRYGTNPGTGFNLSETPTGPLVSWSNAGTPTNTIDTVYDVGDVVTLSGVEYMAQREVTSSAGLQNPSNASPDGYWFRQFTSALELKHTYLENEIFELTFTQSFDVVTIAHPNHPVREIRRLGAQRWSLVDATFNDVVAPTNLTAVPTYGQAYEWIYVGSERPSDAGILGVYPTATVQGLYKNPFARNDLVFCRAPFFPYLDQKFFLCDEPQPNSGGSGGATLYPGQQRCRLLSLEQGGSVGFSIKVKQAAGVLNTTWVADLADVSSGDPTFTTFSYATDWNYQVGGNFPLFANNKFCYPQFEVYGVSNGPAPDTVQNVLWRMTNVAFAPNATNPTSVTFQLQFSSNNGVSWTTTNGSVSTTVSRVRLYVEMRGSTNSILQTTNTYNNGAIGLLQPVASVADVQNTYKVTAVFGDREGPASSGVLVNNNLTCVGSKNTLSWTSVSGATSYNVYKDVSGLFGFVGRSDTASFVDDNITPDFSKTVPYVDNVFTGAGNYPGAVAYFDQRRFFAGSLNDPNKLWGSRSFTENDFSFSLPTNDSDRIAIEIAAREANRIRHIVPLGELLLMTNATEWRVSPINSEALTPSTISARPQSYIGANAVQPIIVNNSAIFCANRGGHVREMGFNFQSQGYVTGDLSIRATHLFDDYELVDLAYQKAPIPVLWAISTSGKMLGLTYVPEEQVGAWHEHETDGVFESVAVTPVGEEDRVWVVVRREINGTTERYVERLAAIHQSLDTRAIFVDAAEVRENQATFTKASGPNRIVVTSPNHGLTSGEFVSFRPNSLDEEFVVAPITNATTNTFDIDASVFQNVFDSLPASGVLYLGFSVVTGLDHLEGKKAAVVADGMALPLQLVTNGQIVLPSSNPVAASIVVGLPYTSEIKTLPVFMQLEASGQGRVKAINKAWVKLYETVNFKIGPNGNMTVPAYPYDTTGTLKTEEIDVTLMPLWQRYGQMSLTNSDPVALSVLGMTLEVAIGG